MWTKERKKKVGMRVNACWALEQAQSRCANQEGRQELMSYIVEFSRWELVVEILHGLPRSVANANANDG